MKQSLDNLEQRSTCIAMLACLAIGLCLFVGEGLRISTSSVDLIGAGGQSRLANATTSESAVKSVERQLRNSGKGPRRSPMFGTIPQIGQLALPDLCFEKSLAEARCERLTTRSLPNDRAPPPLLA